MADRQGKLELNWAQAVGSGLAALSSAVLLSTVGATGTVIGAAVGSVVITVGGAFYSHYLAVSRARMAAARDAAVRRAARAMNRARSESAANPPAAGQRIAEAREELEAPAGRADARVRWQEIVRGLRWKPVLLASAAVFVLVMGTILSLELVTGRALSSYTGGTSADGPRTSIPLPGFDRDEPSDRRPRESDDGRRAVTTDTSGDARAAHHPAARRPGGDGTGVAPADGGDISDTDSDGAGADTMSTSEPAPESTEEATEPDPTPQPSVEEPVEAPAPAAPASPAAPAASTPQPSP